MLQFNAVVYNPIGRSRAIFMKFSVKYPSLSVTDGTGRKIMAQVWKFGFLIISVLLGYRFHPVRPATSLISI